MYRTARGSYGFIQLQIVTCNKGQTRKAQQFFVDQIIEQEYENLSNFATLQKSPKENRRKRDMDFAEYAKL